METGEPRERDERVRDDLLAGPAFEGVEKESGPGAEPGAEPGAATEKQGPSPDVFPVVVKDEGRPHEPGTRNPIGVIYGRRVVLAWNIHDGMDVFVQGKLVSPEFSPNPRWLVVAWNEGRLVLRGEVYSGKSWVVKVAQKLRNALVCKAMLLRNKRQAKKARLAGELAERSSIVQAASEGTRSEVV